MQKLLLRFFIDGDDPDLIYEDAIAREDGEDDVKHLFPSFFILRLVIFFQSADVVWKRTLNKASVKIFKLH